MDDPWTNNEAQARCEARTDRELCPSSAPDDLRGPHRHDETRRTGALGHSSDGPSWIDSTEIRVNTTESRFTTCLNRLLQQNRHLTELAAFVAKVRSGTRSGRPLIVGHASIRLLELMMRVPGISRLFTRVTTSPALRR